MEAVDSHSHGTWQQSSGHRVACKLFFNRVLIWKHWHGYLHGSVGHMLISVSYDVLILKLENVLFSVCVCGGMCTSACL